MLYHKYWLNPHCIYNQLNQYGTSLTLKTFKTVKLHFSIYTTSLPTNILNINSTRAITPLRPVTTWDFVGRLEISTRAIDFDQTSKQPSYHAAYRRVDFENLNSCHKCPTRAIDLHTLSK